VFRPPGMRSVVVIPGHQLFGEFVVGSGDS
jgi:hypothetical protein